MAVLNHIVPTEAPNPKTNHGDVSVDLTAVDVGVGAGAGAGVDIA